MKATFRTVTPRAAAVLGALAAPMTPAVVGAWVASTLPVYAQSGEAGESGAVLDAGAAVTTLTSLGLIEGHLRAGSALYAEGLTDQAVTHMKHPQDEIYTDLEPLLDAFEAPEFDTELATLADAVQSGATPEGVAEARASVLAAIAAARAAVPATPREQAEVIERLLRTAGEEYGIGIVDGAVIEVHEYQDAWGFVQVATDLAAALAATEPKAATALTEALAPTAALFPGLSPEGTVAGTADILFGAAARVELAGLGL